ncbi:MAG: sugar ABC transporter permease [Microthrixaceae bacterium]
MSGLLPDDEDTTASPGGRKQLRLFGYDLRETGMAAAFLAPSLVVFSVFFYFPFARLISWGFYESRQRGSSYENVGFSHFGDVLTSSDFLDGLWISVQFVLLTVPAGLILGTLLAVAAHRRLKGIKIYQTIFSSTIATSVAVAAVLFFGLINPAVGVFKVDWLSNPSTALPALALVAIWKNLGLSFVIVLAGLQAVPDELTEAATIDGYGAVGRFFKVTLPSLKSVLTFLVVALTIFGMQEFALPDIITGGSPEGSTETLVYKIADNLNPTNITTGSVMVVGLFLITLVVGLTQFTLLERGMRND